MLRFGHITEIDVAKGYARVTFIDDGIVSAWLQVITIGSLKNKFFHTFDINEPVAALMDEDSVEGVILGAVFNDSTPPDGGNKDVVRVKYPDNSYVEYNRETHEYTLDIKGKINITSTIEVSITAPVISVAGNLAVSGSISAAGGGLSVDDSGNAEISGNLTIAGSIEGDSVAAGGIDLATHTHTGVQTGGGTSGPPTP